MTDDLARDDLQTFAADMLNYWRDLRPDEPWRKVRETWEAFSWRFIRLTEAHPPQERTEQAIEAGARELFRLGNERIGERKWEDVGHYYMVEARACISAADKSSPQGTVRDPGADLQQQEINMEPGDFHWQNGWYFKRLDDGSVRIRLREKMGAFIEDRVYEAHIPPAEWASIISFVSARGEPAAYPDAVKFHSEVGK